MNFYLCNLHEVLICKPCNDYIPESGALELPSKAAEVISLVTFCDKSLVIFICGTVYLHGIKA